jgi:hypothetical protein
MRRHSSLLIAAGLIGTVGLLPLLIRVCADGGAMGAAYRTCACSGFEWVIYDRTPADGPRRTVCVGILRSKTCHQFRDGPAIPCPS